MAAKRRRKRIVLLVLGMAIGASVFAFAPNRAVLEAADGRVFADASQVPSEPVALVLGTSPRFHGAPNPFFEHRMDAAATLYHEGKVRTMLVSGDNGTRFYDEPAAMREALVARGVPASRIVVDDAGFRTLDSIIRAKRIFGVDRCVIVTDDFHLPRALYIARERQIEAVGYQTVPLPRRISPWTYLREVGARSLVWIDLHILDRQPKFLGKREPIAAS